MGIKRINKELLNIFKVQDSRHLLDNEYIVSTDSTLDSIRVLVRLPKDSVYRHKFLILTLAIPETYPYEPPKMTCDIYNGERIHPNIYEDGKCCATILNTWGEDIREKWTSSMSVNSVILSFMSLFDNDPYSHEPGYIGDKSYTNYVLYTSWCTLLLDYIENEDDPFFYGYINEYIQEHITSIMNDLDILVRAFPKGYYYTRCYDIDHYTIDYSWVKEQIYKIYFEYTSETCSQYSIDIRDNCEYTCEICFDTEGKEDQLKTQQCGHAFHKECIKTHLQTMSLCPICRNELKNESNQ